MDMYFARKSIRCIPLSLFLTLFLERMVVQRIFEQNPEEGQHGEKEQNEVEEEGSQVIEIRNLVINLGGPIKHISRQVHQVGYQMDAHVNFVYFEVFISFENHPYASQSVKKNESTQKLQQNHKTDNHLHSNSLVIVTFTVLVRIAISPLLQITRKVRLNSDSSPKCRNKNIHNHYKVSKISGVF